MLHKKGARIHIGLCLFGLSYFNRFPPFVYKKASIDNIKTKRINIGLPFSISPSPFSGVHRPKLIHTEFSLILYIYIFSQLKMKSTF